jgi:protein-L-isoaspartate O-methyltransferase
VPKLVITHDVVDVDAWLIFKSERADAIGAMGGAQVVDHVAQDGSKRVAVSAEIDDVDAFTAAIASPPPELLAAMERHGVIQPLTAYIER